MAIAFADLSAQHGPGAAADLDHPPPAIADKAERMSPLPQALPKPVDLKALRSLPSSGKSPQQALTTSQADKCRQPTSRVDHWSACATCSGVAQAT